MKRTTKSGKRYEPTISDVLDAVQTGFSRHEGLLTRHEGLLTRHEKLLTTLHEGQENLKEQVKDVDRRLINTQHKVEDIADMLELDHERRIKRLEQVRK